MSSRSFQTVNSVKRLLHINKLLRYFYRGLISNYLNKLHKANLVPISKKQKLAIGYLVLIMVDPPKPRNQWRRGRTIKFF